MEGFSEAIELIQSTAVRASHAESVVDKRNGKVFSHGGSLVTIDNDTPPRRHTVHDLDSLSASIGEDAAKATVWHCGNSVVAVLDDSPASYRDDTVTWPLVPSAKFTALTAKASVPRGHVEFVRFLVENLRDELEAAAPGLLGTIRNLKFRSADEQTGKIDHGRESMGRAIESEITGAGELPETVTINVTRWATLGIEYVVSVECLLVLDVTERKLSLRPLADQLEQAENGAQKWLNGILSDALSSTVVYGSP